MHPDNQCPEGDHDWTTEIAGVAQFTDPEVRFYPWEQDYSAAAYAGLMSTLSQFRLLEPPRRDRLLAAIRDTIDDLVGDRAVRVLDVGCGVGDVSLLAGTLVGPTGAVLGIDRSAEAVDTARGLADGKDVLLAGGVSVAQQALAAGLVDEVVLHVVPKLVGRGVRLFDGGEVDLRCVETIEGEGAVHLRYEVQ